MTVTELAPRRTRIEWPTVGLIVVVYGVLGGLVWNHDILPWWVLLPVGAYSAALHSSLQHEVLHGHPTRNRRFNEALIFLTPTFWLPFGRYRDSHLAHHNDINLTCPVRDPESYYMLPDDWSKTPGFKRALYGFNQTLGGRMLIGPAVSIVQFWGDEFRAIFRGQKDILPAWLLFALSSLMAAVLISGVCGMQLWKYYVLIAYPGISLALVRSYCEHQAAEAVNERTIIVEASPFWSLLFLNNNLHIAHHTRPTMPWYQLPGYYRAERESLIKKNQGYLMRGYGEIFRRYAFRPKEPIPHPNLDWLKK